MSEYLLRDEAQKKRFDFGKNWKNFLDGINNQHIENSKEKLLQGLEMQHLKGKSFLDVGSGSGLSSLSARISGARVYSFDFDEHSVFSTQYLKNKFFKEDPDWQIEKGSVLDKDYMESLGKFDIVYSWGVLHHTGHMKTALENVNQNVKNGGFLFIAIYNDQGVRSRIWKVLKKTYVNLKMTRPLFIALGYLLFWFPQLIKGIVTGKPNFQKDYKKKRGMSLHHDIVDWMGGYPFEVATRETIINLYEKQGYKLQNLISCGNKLGCNEFVFKKIT
ncbi:MAG: class I SAM-dependent methyltransferase [Flavobacteriaceae bacterium]